jgi:hypothetical protein
VSEGSRILIATLVAIIQVFAVSASAAPPNARSDEPCSWGASSIQAEVVDGKVVVVSGPDTTGCIPQSKS